MTLRIDIVTGFPKILESALDESMIKKGISKEAVTIKTHDLRDYTLDKHRTIDDYPYGGGPGMLLKIEPFVLCLEKIDKESPLKEAQLVLMTPRGKQFEQKVATQYSLKSHIVFLCGHYKGIDERIHQFFDIDEISIGDFVLSSGEIAALVVIDSIVRLLPGVLKDIDSAWTDSFSDDLLDSPYYTRPENFRDKKVPQVLLSGDHAKIDKWRYEKKIEITKKQRPDLFNTFVKSEK